MSRKSGKFIVGSAGVAGLALLGVVSFGGAADSRAPADAPVIVASAPAVVAPESAVASSPVSPVVAATVAPVVQTATVACGWPYTQTSCGEATTASAMQRQVRMISINRDAPRSVPVPEAIEEAASRIIVLAAQSVSASEGSSVLPPARPVSLGGVAPDADIETTGSVTPAVVKPQRRRVVQSRRPREDDSDMRRWVQVEQAPAPLFGWLSSSSF